MINYKLTEKGRIETEKYIKELKDKRKKILDNNIDTAYNTDLPAPQDIEAEIAVYIDNDGDYYNSWAVTDHYDSDLPISLTLGVDFHYDTPYPIEDYSELQIKALDEASLWLSKEQIDTINHYNVSSDIMEIMTNGYRTGMIKK